VRDTVTVDLALSCLVALAVAAGLLITLQLLPTGRHPVRDAVSDYGVGPFGPGYRLVVLAVAACDLVPMPKGLIHTQRGQEGNNR
jgi:hypothetical protein